MLTRLEGERLAGWITDAMTSGLPGISTFAIGPNSDYDAGTKARRKPTPGPASAAACARAATATGLTKLAPSSTAIGCTNGRSSPNGLGGPFSGSTPTQTRSPDPPEADLLSEPPDSDSFL
ncbi:hypothetical protein ACFVVU_26800 [Kitasatospora sp. NPDC057965]|uniref:hypothetical protein n=1 Tax=Kitasatospora sp. NPDC057965 TaxID=3346291 RepID=UPI0036DB39D4